MATQPSEALAALTPLLGEWIVEARFSAGVDVMADGPPATTTFAPILGGAFVLQRAEVPAVPAAPDVYALIEPRADGTFLEHYFDSRGVVRRYAMTFAGGVWTLERRRPEADFGQRFSGRVSDDGEVIEGAWQIECDGAFVHDFDLVYRRA
jgi:hypothetical protein